MNAPSASGLGLMLLGAGMTPSGMADWAHRAEASGFDSVWVAEAVRDVFVPLSMIAAATSRARVGTACCIIARPPHVTHLCAQAIDEISKGRLVLGLADGPSGANADWYGDRPEKPIVRMREYLELLRLMMTAHSGSVIDYRGNYYRASAYERRLPPVRERIPLLIGGTGPAMIKLAGSMADGFVANALNAPRYFEETVFPNLEDGLAAAGRSRADLEVVSLRICSVHDQEEEAIRRAKRHVARYVGIAPALARVLDTHGHSREREAIAQRFAQRDLEGAASHVNDAMLEYLTITGTPAAARQKLAEFRQYVDTVILYPPASGLTDEQIVESHEMVLKTFGTSHP